MSFVLRTEVRKSRQGKREHVHTWELSITHGDRVKEFLASGVPPKRLEAYTLTFGGTEGLALVRRRWFDARSYCWFDFG